MAQQRQILALGILGLLLMTSSGCGRPQQLELPRERMANILENGANILGKDVAEYRAAGKGISCPKISSFHAAPQKVECGQEVMLSIAAIAPYVDEVFYSWEIDGQEFDSGTRAIWKTPTCESIKDPQQLYTIRGVASDGECSIAQTVQVQVLCNCPLDLKVNFDFGKAELNATALATLDEFGSTLRNYPSYSVLIEGHTDHIGSEPKNQVLGEKRANAIKEYLIARWGIEPARLMTMSFGEGSPVASNETKDGRAQNRRAEIFRIQLSGN